MDLDLGLFFSEIVLVVVYFETLFCHDNFCACEKYGQYVSYICGKVKSWWFKEGWWDGEELVSLNKEKGMASSILCKEEDLLYLF